MIRMSGPDGESMESCCAAADERLKAIKREFRAFVAANPGCTMQMFTDSHTYPAWSVAGRPLNKNLKAGSLRRLCIHVAGVVGVKQKKQGSHPLVYYIEGTEP